MITVQLLNRALGTGVSAPVAVGIASYIGKKGTDGNTVLYGSGAPSDALGADGNFYIDTTATFIYGPKAAGAWPAGASLIGPAGAPGPVAGTDKQVIYNDAGVAAGDAGFTFDNVAKTLNVGGGVQAGTSGAIGFDGGAGTMDTMLRRGGAGVVEQYNGATPQNFRLYNKSISPADYERGGLRWSANALQMFTEAGGTGLSRSIVIAASGEVSVAASNFLTISTGGAARWYWNTQGHLVAQTNNVNDIGANGNTSPRSIYAATSIQAPRVKLGAFTVATLPSASTAGGGAITYATDLTSLTNGTTAAGGGTLKGIVKSDGTNWIVLG